MSGDEEAPEAVNNRLLGQWKVQRDKLLKAVRIAQAAQEAFVRDEANQDTKIIDRAIIALDRKWNEYEKQHDKIYSTATNKQFEKNNYKVNCDAEHELAELEQAKAMDVLYEE